MRQWLLIGTAALGVVGVAIAQTPARTPAQLIQNRQAGYKQINAAFRAVLEQSRASEPDLAAIRQHSATIARLAPRVSGWFPRGTGPETGVRTRAKAEIWTNPEAFRSASVNLVVAARRLDAAARGSDMAAIRAAFQALGRSCSGCHDQFRGPEA
jgi:cytochrome c556